MDRVAAEHRFAGVRIGLSAVVFALLGDQAQVLTVQPEDQAPALPFGPFDPGRDRTFELALRAFVTQQTGLRLGFVEQLYTFGDLGRVSPQPTPGPVQPREVSVGYLALTQEAAPPTLQAARWRPIADIFPWEDRRRPAGDSRILIDRLSDWAGGDATRLIRIETLFGLGHHRWDESRVLDRYELLYEAGLVDEAARDGGLRPPIDAPGLAMASDHRRILATGLGRLRAKLKYRPVLFDLTPQTFTLSQLQTAAEAVSGLTLHKQNFRRGVERTGLVQPTGQISTGTGGRPAELYALSVEQGAESMDRLGGTLGLPLPVLR